ncbi:MAG: DUF294 nucleotidyltransferase-like domain-containing protein [Bacteroidota bacterium]
MNTLRQRFGNQALLLRIFIPALLTLILFVVSIYQIIIPRFEGIIMDRKREMIRELVNSAWHVADQCYDQARLGHITEAEARSLAIAQIGHLRYGEEAKDYFWITDFKPRMIVHPFREDLNGQDLSDFKDSQGKRLFVEIAAVVKKGSEGYVDYTWQWKDDSTRIVPKLSFVRAFAPWDWIIGTGIYLEDVRAEISSLERNVVTISIWITIAISLLLLLIAVQNLRSEKRRLKVEQDLREAKEKYQALVEASTEGLIMMLEGEQLYLNKKLLAMSGYTEAESAALTQETLLPDVKLDDVLRIREQEQLVSEPHFETRLQRQDGICIDVLLTMSRVSFFGKTAVIAIVEDVSKKSRSSQDAGRLISELQEPLIFLSQPITQYIKAFIPCRLTDQLEPVARMLSKTNTDAALVVNDEGQPVGLLSNDELRKIMTSGSGMTERQTYEAMRSPIRRVDASSTIYDVLAMYAEDGNRCLAVQNERKEIIGTVSIEDIQKSQLHSYLFFLQRLTLAESVAEVKQCHMDLLLYVKILTESGAGVGSLTHATTLIFDAVAKKLLSIVIEELGPPPARFAFIALGSEGRSEATLSADQDNAIIYEDVDESIADSVREYFEQLGARVCDGLHAVGYPYCPGDVMAKNKKWSQPLATWKQYFYNWVNTANPDDLLDVSIFFDFRCISGEDALAAALRDYLFNIISGNNSFFVYLAQNAARVKLPTWQFKAAEFIDVKVALMPLIELARIYSLKTGIRATNTLERFLQLHEQDVFSAAGHKDLMQSYTFLMNMRFQHHAQLLSVNAIPDNAIDTHALGEIEKAMLRRVLSQIEDFRTKLNIDFKGTM